MVNAPFPSQPILIKVFLGSTDIPGWISTPLAVHCFSEDKSSKSLQEVRDPCLEPQVTVAWHGTFVGQ